MEVTKRVAKSGAVTLPRMIRQKTGMLPGVPVDIVADREGIYISKHVPACLHCGSVDDVKTILGLEVCLGCAEKIREVFENGGE